MHRRLEKKTKQQTNISSIRCKERFGTKTAESSCSLRKWRLFNESV